jgi:hypothetical protein
LEKAKAGSKTMCYATLPAPVQARNNCDAVIDEELDEFAWLDGLEEDDDDLGSSELPPAVAGDSSSADTQVKMEGEYCCNSLASPAGACMRS